MDTQEEELALSEENQTALQALMARVTDIENKFFGPDPNLSPDIATNLKQFVVANAPATVSLTGRSHKTSLQTINNTSSTKIVWESNDYASGITWDSGNNRFVIATNGKYLISATILYGNTVDTSFYGIFIYINGSEYSFQQTQSGSGGNTLSPTIFDTADLSVGDYIEIFTFHSSGSSRDISANAPNSYFNIAKIN